MPSEMVRTEYSGMEVNRDPVKNCNKQCLEYLSFGCFLLDYGEAQVIDTGSNTDNV